MPYPGHMSKKEKAARHFNSGLRVLKEAVSKAHESDYNSLLATAVNDFDLAIGLTSLDSEDCGNIYAQVRAAAHAACLLQTRYDSIIDDCFSNPSTMASLANSELRYMENTSEEFVDTAGDDTLGDFWCHLQELVQQTALGFHKGLATWKLQWKHWDAFDTALACASGEVGLERLWYGFIATVLYQHLNSEHPEKITKCITAMRRALELDESSMSTDLSSLGEYADVVLQVVSPLQVDVSVFSKRISWLQSLAVYYAHRWQSSCVRSMKLYESDPDQISSLRDAIEASGQALEWTNNITLLPKPGFKLLFTHGLALHKNYSIYRHIDDLETSVASLRKALTFEETPVEELLPCKALLATALSDLILSLSRPLNETPECFLELLPAWREIDELTSCDISAQRSQRLLKLGRAMESMYDSDSGTLVHLIESSNCLARAAEIEETPAILATILFTRARVLAERAAHPDSDKMLSVGDTALQLVEANPQILKDQTFAIECGTHIDRLLGNVKENVARGDPQASVRHVIRAISVLDLLVSTTDEEWAIAHLPAFRLSLAIAYELLYRIQVRLGQPTDKRVSTLHAALEAGEAALKQIKPQYRARICLALVASIYDELSRLPGQDGTSQSKYNDLAIGCYRRASNKVLHYVKLTNALEKRYLLHGRRQDLDECIQRLILQNKGHSTPDQSFYMSAQLVRLCLEYDVSDKLLLAYQMAFQALRRMSRLGRTFMLRYKALTDVPLGYACDAAAAALARNDTTTAVELLEQGRGCFFSGQLLTQTDSSYIRSFNPALAEKVERKLARIQELTREIDESLHETQMSPVSPDIFYEDGLRMQFEDTPNDVRLDLVVGDIEEALQTLRMQPDYNDMTQPKPFASLRLAASFCPIAYINTSQFRCDAIILQERSGSLNVLVVSLPTTRDTISDLSLKMQKVIRDQGRGCRDVYPEPVRLPVFLSYPELLTPDQQVCSVLRDLWNMVARPVLEALDFMKSLDGVEVLAKNLPHICWCLTGPMASFLPLHAAGDYSLGPEHWAMSHVVSSYTPTVTALVRAQERGQIGEGPDTNILLISQPASPPSSPLRFVNKERDSIVAAMSRLRGDSRVTVLHDKAGLVADAIALLPSHSILHLACHGKQEKEDPLESAIILHDGHLKLREVIKAKLPSAELVYRNRP
ncbi:hypothetical protein FRC07_006782 [Ceratobasidium sp. 392]|nr:hypothetical protein FRC07_006782 [Ceratobasidium sp. 392]